MSREIPVRDLAGKIIGLQSGEEIDTVQATLEASLKAVGAFPTPQQPPLPARKTQPPQRPSKNIVATAIAVVSMGVLYFSFFTGQRQAPSQVVSLPQSTVVQSPHPSPTALPRSTPQPNPQEVTLSPIALYGDYDENTLIGVAPDGIVCSFSGQSPDLAWAFLSCPPPTGQVWAKVAALVLTDTQRSTLLSFRIVARAAPTVPSFSPPIAAQQAGHTLTFCADRVSAWGSTHQCADSQAAADAQADAEIGKINAAAQVPAPSTPTARPEVVAFKESFKEPSECSPFIGYVGEKARQCAAVQAAQTTKP